MTIRRALRIRQYNARQCHVEAQAWVWRFQQIVEEVCDKKLYWEPTDPDKLRLLNLRAWALKYRVSEEFVVSTLVNYWSKRAKHWEETDGRRRKRVQSDSAQSIGCKIPTLTGKVSEEILKQAVTSEQVQSDRIARQEQDLEAYNAMHFKDDIHTVEETDTPKDFVKAYTRLIVKGRKEYDKVKTILSRRRYPHSPWY